MTFTIKGLKTWHGMEGHAFQCSLYADRKRIAVVTEEATGGPMRWDVLEPEAVAAFGRHHGVADLLVGPRCAKIDTDADMAVVNLVVEYESAKQLRRWCKKETLFRLPDDKEGTYRTIRRPFSGKVRDYILTKYPTAEIMNERITA